jgi:hypothetical protein
MNFSPLDQYRRSLLRIETAVALALLAKTFPAFIRSLDSSNITFAISYSDIALTDQSPEGAHTTAINLPCYSSLKAKLEGWHIESAGHGLSSCINNVLAMRFQWVRGTDYREDLPNFDDFKNCYLTFAAELNSGDLYHAVNITLGKTKLRTPNERGKYLAGICKIKIRDKNLR